MGGRGGFGGNALSGIKKRAESWFNEFTKFERRQDDEYGTDSRVQGLKKSPTFMSHLREQIERDAFDQGYEIRTKQVDKIVTGLFDKAKRKKK